MTTPTWPQLPRPVRWRKSGKGENLPRAGRKFCSSCGRWRLLIDFQCSGWTKRGYAWRWQSRCQTCYRVHKRVRGGHRPRQVGRAPKDVQLERNRLNQARRLSDPERRERRREYDRMYKAAQRRAAGITPRPFTKPRPYETTKVPNAPVREAFLASSLTAADVCERLGWLRREGKGDSSKLTRMLGIMETAEGGLRDTMKPDDAAAVLRVLGVDPVDVGL